MVCSATTFTGLNLHDRRWTNWSGEVQFTASEYWEPAHSGPDAFDGLQQLVHVVEQATAQDKRLHAIGSGWAFEELAASDDWVVSLASLDRELQHVVGAGGAGLTDAWRTQQADPAAATVLVHVEAGIRVATLNELLATHDLAMPTLGGANGQALAGVVSTSTHGGDWQQPPFPDLVRAIHLVTDGGREVWLERASAPVTTDARLRPLLACADATILRDDRAFDAALVACGRFGILYSLVLEVRRAFRVVEVVTTPTRSAVLQALRDGVTQGTVLQPLFDDQATMSAPAGLTDATGTPTFLQVLFNSQNPEDVWVHRRWETTVAGDLPAPPPLPTGGTHVVATSSDHDTAVLILEAANLALATAAAVVAPIPFASFYVLGVQIAMNAEVASRAFTLGSVVAAALSAVWRVPAAGHAIPGLNFMVLDSRFRPVITAGRRGPHHLMTSGNRSDSDSTSFRAASVELVFDATTTAYLDFLDDVLSVAPRFQQAGYVSLRPSLASKGLLSMHHVGGTHAMSIEISSLQGLPGNDEWMRYVHRAAVALGGRPHWGQFNRLDAVDVAMLYAGDLNSWREGLLTVSGTSMRFSNTFTRARGLEPASIVREVTAVRRTEEGVVTHLCHDGEGWSPIRVGAALREIEAGTVAYWVGTGPGAVPIDDVVGGSYLRTRADATSANNLDHLPLC